MTLRKSVLSRLRRGFTSQRTATRAIRNGAATPDRPSDDAVGVEPTIGAARDAEASGDQSAAMTTVDELQSIRVQGLGEWLWVHLVRPLLFRLLEPELSHNVTFAVVRVALRPVVIRRAVGRALAVRSPSLRTTVLGMTLANPIGLAAGFDKDGTGFRQLAALGFGFLEIGTVTPRAQPGNPQPRLYRLPSDRALLNRMGFNSAGAGRAAKRLSDHRPGAPPIGVNVGHNKGTTTVHDEYVEAARLLSRCCDYITINISSPNTAGLRELQVVNRLRPLIERVRAEVESPILLKLAPDLSDTEIDALCDLALQSGVDGVIATNTTVNFERLSTPPEIVGPMGLGGVSGPPIAAESRRVIGRVRARAGDRLVIVACGGIETAEDAWVRIKAGATLLQVYTGLIYRGPTLIRNLLRGLDELARAEGFERVQDAVGVTTDAHRFQGAKH